MDFLSILQLQILSIRILIFVVNGINVFYGKCDLNLLGKWINGESKYCWAFFHLNGVNSTFQIHRICSWCIFGKKVVVKNLSWQILTIFVFLLRFENLRIKSPFKIFLFLFYIDCWISWLISYMIMYWFGWFCKLIKV